MEKTPAEKSLIEKLGITQTTKVALISPAFENQVEVNFQGHLGLAATPKGLEALESKLDIILVWIDTTVDLIPFLTDLKRYINDAGAIWTIVKKKSGLPKGVAQSVTENDIINGAKAAGLVDNKIVSISDTEYAFRLVIPVVSRGEG